MLTFYGVLPRIYSYFGEQVEIGLVVDVMTSPSHQGKGLFVESSQGISRLDGKSSSKCQFTFFLSGVLSAKTSRN